MTPWWMVLICGVVIGSAASSSSSSLGSSTTGRSGWLTSSSLGTMGYPELLLPKTRGTPETTLPVLDNPRVQNSTLLPAVLNYVSPWIGQLQLLRDPTGHDTFLPPDPHHLRNPAASGASSTSVPSLPSSTSAWDPRTVTLHNGRLQHSSLTLDANGFQLVRSPKASQEIDVDFYDPADVTNTYYPMCESLVRGAWEGENRTTHRSNNSSSGGDRVHVFAFDHNVRHGTDDGSAPPHDRDEGEGLGGDAGTSQTTPNVLPPAGIVHNDYTSVSAPRRLEQLASLGMYRNDVMTTNVEGGEAQHRHNRRIPALWVQEALQGKRRYAFVNVWRSIDPIHPVQSFPLALLDAPSAHFLRDIRPLTIHYVDRVGENYVASFHPDHRWYYFPNMNMNEAILIKQWDSWGDLCHRRRRQSGSESNHDDLPSQLPPHRSTFALHTAFALAPPDSRPLPPRKSIEVRCLCLWDCADAEDDEPLETTTTIAEEV